MLVLLGGIMGRGLHSNPGASPTSPKTSWAFAAPGGAVYGFIFGFGATPGSVWGVLLALNSGLTRGSIQGTLWDAGNRTPVGCVQSQRPPRCLMPLALGGLFLLGQGEGCVWGVSALWCCWCHWG